MARPFPTPAGGDVWGQKVIDAVEDRVAEALAAATDHTDTLEAALPVTYATTEKMRGPIAKWAPNTAYVKSAVVIAPDGSTVKALAAFTSGATYDPANWSGNMGFISAAGTPIGSPPVVKPAGDGRNGVWEYTHNDTAGYLYHLLMGADSGSGAWIAGIGIDGGSGNGFIFRNKSKGIAVKVEQLPSITSATAYGLAVEQKSALAPAVSMVQTAVGTANLLELFSYITDPNTTSTMQVWNAYTGPAGGVNSYSGQLTWYKKMQVRGDVGFDARSSSVKADEWAKHTKLNHNGLQFENPSAAGSWYAARIQMQEGAEADRLNFQTTLTTTTPDTATYTTQFSIRHNRLGFFGVTPALRPTLSYSRTGESAPEAAIRTALATLGLVLDSTTA